MNDSRRPGRRTRGAATAGPAVLVALAVVLTAACGAGDQVADGEGPGGPDGTVSVFAAASVGDALAEVGEAFEAANPGVTVRLNPGPSSGLREQILAGAPADVYASADRSNMDSLVEAGEADAPEVFARNRMSVAVPAGNPAGVTGLADLADPDLLLGLCAEQVPCGRFGREVLARAGIAPSPDTNATDVRALLTQIESGDLDAGLVYRTDVMAGGGGVEGIEVPATANVEVELPVAVLAGAADPGAARELVDFVLSPHGSAILADHGFDPG